MQAVLGTGPYVDGLATTPGSGMTVSVAAGQIFAQVQTDATAYGSLGTDTHQLVKQGLSLDPVVLSTPAPSTSGQSINYLVEVAYADVDLNSTLLSYFNSANPLGTPLSGPANSGASQNTIRRGECVVQIKAGTPATTGSQTTPSPDSGYIGIYVVTVAYGATSISSGNIAMASGAPFINPKLPAIGAAIAAAQAAAEAFATAADVTVLSSAETYAASQAATAQSNAETYAASQAATAQSTAESFATAAIAALGIVTSGTNTVKLGQYRIEWGYTPSVTTGTSSSVTFGTAFSATPYVVASPTSRGSTAGGGWAAESPSTSGFTMDNHTDTTQAFTYVAFGLA